MVTKYFCHCIFVPLTCLPQKCPWEFIYSVCSVFLLLSIYNVTNMLSNDWKFIKMYMSQIYMRNRIGKQNFLWLNSPFLLGLIVINSSWAQDATSWHRTYSSAKTLKVNRSCEAGALCRCWLQGHCCSSLYLDLLQLWTMWVPAMCPLSGGQAVECRGHKHFKSYKTFIKFSRYLTSGWPFLILVLFSFFFFFFSLSLNSLEKRGWG